MYLLDNIKPFGGPSASLLRSSVVQERQPFYTVGNYHGDTEAQLDLLGNYDFGFVHQVLSFNRWDEDSRTTHYLKRVNSYSSAVVEELLKFGPRYLTEDELQRRLKEDTHAHYQFLADTVLRLRKREVWDYHRDRMERMGAPIDYVRLARYVAMAIADRVLNPKRTLEGVTRALFARRNGASGSKT